MIQTVVSKKMAELSEMGFEITLAHVQLICLAASTSFLPHIASKSFTPHELPHGSGTASGCYWHC